MGWGFVAALGLYLYDPLSDGNCLKKWGMVRMLGRTFVLFIALRNVGGLAP